MSDSTSRPATPKQRAYIGRLLATRAVPNALYWQVRHAMGTLTDGDCRRFIPDLEKCDLVEEYSATPEGYDDSPDQGVHRYDGGGTFF